MHTHSCPHDMYYMMEMELPQFHPLTVPTKPRKVKITGIFKNSVELNWLPPTDPNGETTHQKVAQNSQLTLGAT